MAAAVPVSGQQPVIVPGRPPKWRVLGVLTGPTADAIVEGDQRGLGAIEEIFELPGTEAEVHVIKYPRLEDLSAQLQGWKPNFVYVYGGVNGDKRDLEKQSISHLSFLVDSQGRFIESALHLFLASFGGLHLDTVYFDAQGCTQIGEALHAAGVPNVVVWPRESPPLCLPAMHFAHAFFCMLRNRSITVPEAFAMASHLSKAHCTQASGDVVTEPRLPRLLSRLPSGLPSITSIPPLLLGGKDVSASLAAAVPGYDQVRLLAPNAELRMLACGLSSFINPQTLAYLGESLRSLITMEVRRLVVQRLTPCEKKPEHLPANCSAVRCELLSFSGAPITVVLGGPVEVLQNQAVVEHALRQTMVADAHSLQFKLPPHNVPLPASRTNPAVASGAPVVEALVVTSVWCVQLLKMLCQDAGYRGLVALGLGAISNTPVAAFTKADANRYTTVITNNDPTKLIQAPAPADATSPQPVGVGPASTTEASEAPLPTTQPSAAAATAPAAAPGFTAAPMPPASAFRPPPGAPLGAPPLMASLPRSGSFGGQLPAQGASAAQAGSSAMGSQLDGGRSESPEHTSAGGINPMHIRPSMQVAPWRSSRPPVKQCSEEQFMSDLIAFLTDRQGRQIDPKSFPEAILNGSRLDLFNLYKEVCNRGGYQVGNGINWKGQVFPRMRNYTAQHKMTGVGNALKRHYQMFLLEYEHAHPGDVNGGQCALCGQGEECGTDWISCDMCDCWVHFSCDKRPFLGAFKEYARGRTRTYCCPRCYEIKRQRTMQQQQMEDAAAAAAPPPAPLQPTQPLPVKAEGRPAEAAAQAQAQAAAVPQMSQPAVDMAQQVAGEPFGAAIGGPTPMEVTQAAVMPQGVSAPATLGLALPQQVPGPALAGAVPLPAPGLLGMPAPQPPAFPMPTVSPPLHQQVVAAQPGGTMLAQLMAQQPAALAGMAQQAQQLPAATTMPQNPAAGPSFAAVQQQQQAAAAPAADVSSGVVPMQQ